MKKLSELKATAICGNDISSSCLYVSAISIAYAGAYAWIALLMVAAVLFLYRKIYAEVVGALPLNGGAYNVLLNTTTKIQASVAACFTILSYMATAVISAGEAMNYLHSIFSSVNVLLATVVLLLFFLVLNLLGITESARVATFIFLFHLTALSVLVIAMGVYLVNNGTGQLHLNFSAPLERHWTEALFFGFSAAMLGISGFESSANYVEEQKQGVFPKTLRNMWIIVSFFNPVIAFLAVAAMPLHDVSSHSETLLSQMGSMSGGTVLAYIISIDAVLVLSGAVLTSFVGVSGLVKRMALDRILPQFFLKANRFNSSYVIFIFFFFLCLSVLFFTQGSIMELAGVYTISFLSVMCLFAAGNFLLKYKRASLPRPEKATNTWVLVALLTVAAALYGNIRLHPEYLVVFLQYFIPTLLAVYLLLNRNIIALMILNYLKSFSEKNNIIFRLLRLLIRSELDKLRSQQFVFFSKADDIPVLNKVMMYVVENEITHNLKVVTVLNEHREIPASFKKDFDALDRAYPEIKIDYIVLRGEFTPGLVDELSREWNIPKNFMFIGSPGDKFPYRVAELGGVRLIM